MLFLTLKIGYLDAHVTHPVSKFIFAGDDDSGTDENCDSPPLTPPSPPTSGFAMASKMTVGVSSSAESESEGTAKSCDAEDADNLLHYCVGLLFSSNLPTVETLTKLRQTKKVQCLYQSKTLQKLLVFAPLNDVRD